MHTDYLTSRLIENSVNLLTDFFTVVNDGYNPAGLLVKIDLTRNITNEELFIYNENHGIGSKGYYETRILPTKVNIESVQHQIRVNFKWCLEHLILFSKVPELFKSEFHYENLKSLVKKVEDQIITFIEPWNTTAVEYTNETGGGSVVKVLIVHGKNKSLVLEFYNEIH